MALNPRWRKEWIPLFSQQLRLRNLTQVLAYNVRGSAANAGNARPLFYYTLHLTSKSAPVYTSEPCSGPNPRWAEIDLQRRGTLLSGTGVVVRIWQSGSPDHLVVTWGLHLSGLVPVESGTDLSKELGVNALVLYMHGSAFVIPTAAKPATRLIKAEIAQGEARKSYTVPSLLRLHRVQLDTAEQALISDSLKQSIQLLGPFPPPSLGQPGRRYLAQQLLSAREEARHRLWLLRGERARRAEAVASLKVQAEKLEQQIQTINKSLKDQEQVVSREKERLQESRLEVTQTREALALTTAKLFNRSRHLISQLKIIYPITEDEQGNARICDVVLLSSEALGSQDDSSSAVALGFAAHATAMVAVFLDVPLRYPIVAAGSRARVWDLVAPKLPDSEREFPLFSRGRDKIQFNYAVYLLNKNIAQLRWYCGLPTRDLRATLLNLRDLLHMKTSITTHHKRSLSGSSLELSRSGGSQAMIPPHSNESLAPLQHLSLRTSLEKAQKTSGSLESWEHCFMEPPISREMHVEKELSCSLDQGLDSLSQPRLNQISGLLSSSKTANSSEPSLPRRGQSDDEAITARHLIREHQTDSMSLQHLGESDTVQLCVSCADITIKSAEQCPAPAEISVSRPEEAEPSRTEDEKVVTDISTVKQEDSRTRIKKPNVPECVSREEDGVFRVQQQDIKKIEPRYLRDTPKLRTFSEPCSSDSRAVVDVFHDCLTKFNTDASKYQSPSAAPNGDTSLQNVTDNFLCVNSKENIDISDSDSMIKKFSSIDNLFANVASRTEALASRSGSFNLVKSRANTMEGS